MSLLLKALKQAELGPDKAAGKQTDELDFEPMETPPFSVRREWVQPHDTEPAPAIPPGRPTATMSWPLGLVPTTALLAMLIAVGYGIYVYLSINPPALLVAPTSVPRPSAPTAKPIQFNPLPPNLIQVPPHPIAAIPKARPARPRASTARAASMHATGAPSAPTEAAVEGGASGSSVAPLVPALQGNASQADLDAAYQAYQSGHLEEARRLYSQIPERDRNPDVLLGLAAIAMAQGQQAESIRLYQRVLSIDPRNTVAQAALLDALGTTDGAAAESRLENLIQETPSAFLYYALGNLYADQNRWSDAESAYFEAFRREPTNGDYAFNLAVSLDQLHQREGALRQYEAALNLAGSGSRFSRDQAQTRIRQLKGN
ncbi:MAG: tetratricopeptide repeat protein [Thiobacillaceae bacterium]